MTQTISPATHLIIKGARQHNLKNLDLTLPKNQLVVFTGLSGSGKSSLAFDTIYAEGQRRYVESLSSYARQFLGIMQKPDVDQIDGLSPSISIDQKTTSHNPRSTVGTITEIYDYFRLLYARIGHPHCPQCGSEISPQSIDQITASTLSQIKANTHSSQPTRWLVLSPIVRDKKGEFSGLLDNLRKKGFSRVRIDGRIFSLDEDFLLIKTNRHTIEVVVERLSLDSQSLKTDIQLKQLQQRLSAAIETSLNLADGLVVISQVLDASLTFPDKPTDFQDHVFSQKLACPTCNQSFPDLEPRLFSFNTPEGACPTCTGLGKLLKIDPQKIIAPDLTLSEGAIIPLANALGSDTWYNRKLKVIFDAYQIPIMTPFKDIPQNVIQVILYGENRNYRVTGLNSKGEQVSFSFRPEGIIPELERRYQETQSEFMRSEIGRFMQAHTCPDCHGARLKPQALSVTIKQLNLFELTSLPINELIQFIYQLLDDSDDPLHSILSPTEKSISLPILKEIKNRVEFLLSVGLDYLSLSREAGTLAGGEAQRIRLASQIGTGLTGVLYVLDEPTIGLHSQDNDRLITTLKKLRDLGNSVIVVEHDEEVIKAADYICDFGPKAGLEGGYVVAQGSLKQVMDSPHSLTGKYLSHTLNLDRSQYTKPLASIFSSPIGLQSSSHNLQGQQLTLSHINHHNLQDLSVNIPLNQFVAITGVSGSGKSSLMYDTLYPALKQTLGLKVDSPPPLKSITGTDGITKVLMIDQSPIGRTPRSNPATYTKAFDLIRDIFAQTKDAKALGYRPGRFSFNIKGGRCEACQGGGELKISMQFLSDVYVPCDVCHGQRYNQETLSVLYHGLSISEVLNLTVNQAVKLFQHHSGLAQKLLTLQAVGLGYLKLGQPAPTLSGGEAQRVKLAKELASGLHGHTVYLLDEPTTGLHFDDVGKLLGVLHALVAQNNTVVVIEHNLDVIRNADWIIDLGPGGGKFGGKIVATGTPDTIRHHQSSATGRYL